MKWVLVKISLDYADEFDVSGFLVEQKEIWEKNVEIIRNKIPELEPEIGFGTNEAIIFDDFSIFEDGIDVEEIDPVDVSRIIHVFGSTDFGVGADIISRLLEKCKGAR